MTEEESRKTGTCTTCTSTDCEARTRLAGETEEEFQTRRELAARICRISHKIVVLSGKGGVGKSTVAANIAMSLALAGRQVGLLDVDIHGPSIPQILGLDRSGPPTTTEQGLEPVRMGNLKVMSIGFLLATREEAVIWRGPMKFGVIRQFLKDVAWGDCDLLVVDCPPGTGDEPLSIAQLIPDVDGAVVVTTPQDLALSDVRRSIGFCRTLDMPILGIVENMSGFRCPSCGEVAEIFGAGGGERMAAELDVPFLGRIPIDPEITDACDRGMPYVYHYGQTETAKAFANVIRPILGLDENERTHTQPQGREDMG